MFQRSVVVRVWVAVLGAIVLVAGGALIGAAAKHTNGTAVDASSPTTVSEVTTTLATAPPTTAAPVVVTQPPTSPPTAAPRWVAVYSAQAAGEQTSAPFALQTGQGRVILTESPDSNGDVTVYWYLYRVGQSSSGASAENGRCSKSCQGFVSNFYVDPGSYYLKVTSVAVHSVRVEEMR